jgi:hypothetical protein
MGWHGTPHAGSLLTPARLSKKGSSRSQAKVLPIEDPLPGDAVA